MQFGIFTIGDVTTDPTTGKTPTEKARIKATQIHMPLWVVSDNDRAALDRLERAVETRDVLSFCYTDETGKETERHVRPLGLWFWGKVWTLVAWCEMRDDFRTFRVDRLTRLEPAGRGFRHERGKTLADFYRRLESRGESWSRAV